jgi:hypothetical protein
MRRLVQPQIVIEGIGVNQHHGRTVSGGFKPNSHSVRMAEGHFSFRSMRPLKPSQLPVFCANGGVWRRAIGAQRSNPRCREPPCQVRSVLRTKGGVLRTPKRIGRSAELFGVESSLSISETGWSRTQSNTKPTTVNSLPSREFTGKFSGVQQASEGFPGSTRHPCCLCARRKAR